MNEKPEEEILEEGHSLDSNWKGGIFYFNKIDKRIFPPKRNGKGWTINFANPISVLGMIGATILICYMIKYFM